MIVDIHAHMDYEAFEKDLDEVLKRAKQAGVSAIINNGTHPASNRKTLELAKKYPIIKAALGYYPLHAIEVSQEEFEEELKFIESQKENIIAIGEVGLDFHRDKNPDNFEKQKKCFQKIIELSEKIKKPLIVHSRGCEEIAFDMVKSSNAKAVMHCFGGKSSLAKRIADEGYHFSIPCNVVRSKSFQKLVKSVNINQIFTETDAPYLSPVPETRNEPANIKESIKKIAELKGFTEEDTENNLFLNYQRFFL